MLIPKKQMLGNWGSVGAMWHASHEMNQVTLNFNGEKQALKNKGSCSDTKSIKIREVIHSIGLTLLTNEFLLLAFLTA